MYALPNAYAISVGRLVSGQSGVKTEKERGYKREAQARWKSQIHRVKMKRFVSVYNRWITSNSFRLLQKVSFALPKSNTDKIRWTEEIILQNNSPGHSY